MSLLPAIERVTLRGRRNSEKINLNLRIPTRDLNSKDRSDLLSLMLAPLSIATIQAIIDVIPSPHAEMLNPNLSESHADPKSKLEKDPYSCDASESAHVLGYVNKMFAVPTAQLPQYKKRYVPALERRASGSKVESSLEPEHLPLPLVTTLQNL